ncbi:MAG: bifunctional riboflavin kinase/FAD synthetase [Actinomycetales bacterium]
MLRWGDVTEVPEGFGPSVVSIGVFDGVHRGHRAVIGAAVSGARELGAQSVVVTFDPHPLHVLRPDAALPLVSSLSHRLALLEELGVDAALVLPFDRERAGQSPEDFVAELLVSRLQARRVVVGDDFRFGAKAAGDVPLLRRLGDSAGFDVVAVTAVGDDERWSSTLVRRLVANGDVAGAAAVLGRAFRVEGEVVHGDHRGREIGYPTANLASDSAALVPADGVYAGWLVRADGARLPAAISIGTNPTFDGQQRRVEGYALDRNDLDLYGEHIAYDFVARLRDTLRFDTVDALLEQMAQDVDTSRDLLRGAAEGQAADFGRDTAG